MIGELRKLWPNWLPKEFIKPLLFLHALAALTFAIVFFQSPSNSPIGWLWVPWNIFLAWLPLLFTLGILRGNHKQNPFSRILAWLCWPLWLLFYPNAPYMLTNLIHLRFFAFVVNGNFTSEPAPWFALLLILAGVTSGVSFGFVSLAMLQRHMAKKHGNAWGWVLGAGTCILSGIAIWMGRVLRLNSWYIWDRPYFLLRNTLASFDRNALVLCIIFAAMCMGSYVLFWLFLPKESKQ